jgi:hypothetical protein
MLPFVMMPRPLQESNVVGKAGTAGFLGRAYDPYYLYPPGDDMDMNKMENIKVDDLKLRTEVPSARLERRAKLRDLISGGMPALEKATAKYDLDEYYSKALGLVISGRARNAFDLTKEKPETRERYGKNTFGQSLLLARRLIEAGTRFVEVNWPKDDGRDHWPYCYTAVTAGAGVKRGTIYGKSDKTASAPVEKPVHPMELLATIYHSVGIDPATIVYNHLNQPRELVQAEPVFGLLS